MFFQKINSFLNCVYEGMMSNMSPIAWTLYCSDHSMAANNEYNEIWEILDRTQLSKHNKYFATTNTRESWLQFYILDGCGSCCPQASWSQFQLLSTIGFTLFYLFYFPPVTSYHKYCFLCCINGRFTSDWCFKQ